MSLLIYPAQEEDMAYIREKLKKYLLDATNIEQNQFLVAKSNNRVVAFGRSIDHETFFEIASLGVDYYQRKKGFGRIILRELVQKAQLSDGQKPIYVLTRVKEFMSRCGFVSVKESYPKHFNHKRDYLCHLDASKIEILRYAKYIKTDALSGAVHT